jgi:hypothetical protein
MREEGEALLTVNAVAKMVTSPYPRTGRGGSDRVPAVMRRCVKVCLSGAVVAAGASMFATGAQASTVCGTVPAVGVVWRVASANLELHLTGQFADADGDHEAASITMTGHLPKALGPSRRDSAIFFGCPGRTPKWSAAAVLPKLTFAVNDSWYEPNTSEPGNPPLTSSCEGTFQADAGIDAAWHTQLLTESGPTRVPRTPELLIGSYVNPSRAGSCDLENREILRDAAAAGLGKRLFETFRLPAGKLWHSARRLTVPVDASYSGKVPQYGYQEYAPGPVSTLDFHWQGAITFSRAYTCTPNGCRLPEELF